MMNSFLIPSVHAADVIQSAPNISVILLRALQFLLSIAGVLGIIGLVITGMMYLVAAGDTRRIEIAKRAAIASAIGVVMVLGALVLVSQLIRFFS